MIKEKIANEIRYKFVRSSGKGGQNVNKVSTCVQLFHHIQDSEAFTEKEKERIVKKLANKINSDGDIVLECSDTRSQLKNKELVFKKYIILLDAAIVEKKKRIQTQMPDAVKLKRLSDKKMRSEIKSMRRNDFL